MADGKTQIFVISWPLLGLFYYKFRLFRVKEIVISVDFITLMRTGIRHSVLPLDSRGMDFGAKIKYRGKEFFWSQGGDKLRGRKRILLDHPRGKQLVLGK